MENQRDSFFLKKMDVTKMKEPVTQQKDRRQKQFDKNRGNTTEEPAKKPFDKKTYRLKKYSKKYKLEQWEEQRKKKLLREYHKDIQNSSDTGTYKPKSFDEDVPDGNEAPGKYVRHPDFIDKETSQIKSKRDPFQKAKEHYNKVKEEKLQKQLEIQRIKAEKQEKLAEYKKKKHEKYKKLSKKTKKGQPVMTGRLELLLEKIQNSK